MKRWRVGVMAVLLAAASGPWDYSVGQAAPADASRLSRDQARRELNRVIGPLIERSERDGLKGKVLPDDLPAPPYRWAHPQLEERAPGAPFLRALRTLITYAVCEREPEAMRSLDRVAKAIDSFVFTEPQALYLERRARTLGINAPFHLRFRNALPSGNGSNRVSTEPQLVMRITVAFDEQRDSDALTLVPAFDWLCRG